jgi:branched-chain amino acid transport system substrate-binding protein
MPSRQDAAELENKSFADRIGVFPMSMAQKLRYRVGCGTIKFTFFLILELSMQMKLKITVAAAIAVVGGMALAQEVVKIGHVAPMSGGQAHYGKDNENGVRMAIEDINAQNPTIGGKKVKFEIAAEDDAADPKQGTAVAQKLCDAKVAGVVGHLNSGTTIPASKIYNDCGIPHITGAATNPNLTKPGYKTTYRIIANDNSLGAGLAVYAAKTMKLKRIAVVDDRTAYGQGVAEVFKKTALADGIQIVDDQYTTDKATDFMAILTAIKSKNPDGIFYGGMDAQAGAMLRQMDQLGMSKVKFFGGDGICTAELIKIASGAKTLDGVVCAEGGASIAKMPGGTAWKAKYDAKYPGQFQIYSPFTYDATFVLVDAMKRANSTNPKVYIPKLAETNFKGVTANIAFESNGELKNPSMTLSTYKDGKKVSLN